MRGIRYAPDFPAMEGIVVQTFGSHDPQDYWPGATAPTGEEITRLLWAFNRISVRYVAALHPHYEQHVLARHLGVAQPSIHFRRVRGVELLRGLLQYPKGKLDSDIATVIRLARHHERPTFIHPIRCWAPTGRKDLVHNLVPEQFQVKQTTAWMAIRSFKRIYGKRPAVQRLMAYHDNGPRNATPVWGGPELQMWREWDRGRATAEEMALADSVISLYRTLLDSYGDREDDSDSSGNGQDDPERDCGGALG